MRDTLGRNNRQLANRECPECRKCFRPLRATSKYCSRPCLWKNNGGQNRKLVGAWYKNPKGYIQGHVWRNGKKLSYKLHRWLMEQKLGRRLLPDEDVHHINGIKDDNRLENLEVIEHGKHTTMNQIGKPSRNPKGRPPDQSGD